MSSLDAAGSDVGAAQAQAAGLERLGRWLIIGYWLALFGVFAIGGIAAGN